jgi:hypothetical protein
MSTLVVVDGHNVFNDVGRVFEGHDEKTLAYVRDWFDVDRLVNASLGQDVRLNSWSDLGIVVFHSNKRLGNGTYSLAGEATGEFWARQGAAPNTAAMLVEVPGARSGKDVGMDISIAVYLFETAERWDAAVLFTEDADFAPAVWSLRRRGKRVYCSSPARNRATPLVQACQSFLPWDMQFLRADRALFEFLSPGGALDAFLAKPLVAGAPPTKIELTGGGVKVAMRVSASVTNTMSECLRDAGLRELYSGSAGEALLIQAQSRDRPEQGIAHGNLVFDGARRHAETFADAKWQELYRD